jgi:hypothetical protein
MRTIPTMRSFYGADSPLARSPEFEEFAGMPARQVLAGGGHQRGARAEPGRGRFRAADRAREVSGKDFAH